MKANIVQFGTVSQFVNRIQAMSLFTGLHCNVIDAREREGRGGGGEERCEEGGGERKRGRETERGLADVAGAKHSGRGEGRGGGGGGV